MKILVIDDDKTLRFVVSQTLSKAGHQIIEAENDFFDAQEKFVEAENGEQGIQKVMAEKPDLILLDVMMPDVSGLEVCAQLKKNPATQSIPIFMLTGRTQVQDIEEALAAGADNYISKPFDPQKLSRIIEVKMKNL